MRCDVPRQYNQMSLFYRRHWVFAGLERWIQATPMEETEKQAEATFVMLFFIMGVGIDFLLLHAPDSKLSSGPAHQVGKWCQKWRRRSSSLPLPRPASSLRQSDCFVESLVGGSTSLGISETGTGGILASVKSGAQSMGEVLHARFANDGSNAIYEICLYYGC